MTTRTRRSQRASQAASKTEPRSDQSLRLGLPKGRMQEALFCLLRDAGIDVRITPRAYRPELSIDAEAKLLKPQNILRMLAEGSRDCGFAGADWVRELDLDLIEVLDLGLDPVSLVVAAPRGLATQGRLPKSPLTLATEYVGLAESWIRERGLDARVIRSFGATEVFPPEDADLILDNTATGATLRANELEILDEVGRSTTRFYANRSAFEDPRRGAAIRALALSLEAVLNARQRVMVEANVPADRLDEIVETLPSMRQPTVSRLARNDGFAIKAAVARTAMVDLVPRLRALGATDLVITRPEQVLP